MNFDILNNLVLCPSVSGHESNIMKYIISFLSDDFKESIDLSPDYIYVSNSKEKHKDICFILHVDEVGFEFGKSISDNTIELSTIGSVPEVAYWGEIILDADDNVLGCIQPKDELSIYGSHENEIVLRTFNNTHSELKGKAANIKSSLIVTSEYIIGKGLDNKIGIMLILDLIKQRFLQKYNASVLFTTKEEIMATQYPDVIFNTKIFAVIDAYSTIEDDCFLCLGPILDGSKNDIDDFIEHIKKKEISYQKATHIQKTGTEIDILTQDERYNSTPFCILSYPLSFMHTPKEMASISDCIELGKIIISFAEYITNKKFQNA
ncbi:hypothetical protein FDW89_13710 [Citrobacter sp. wls830]|nr:hypothetical protein FDW89_13710 [Citrobacter sp. wls830]